MSTEPTQAERDALKEEQKKFLFLPQEPELQNLNQSWVVVSLCGPMYKFRTKKLEFVIHQAFARLPDAVYFMNEMLKEKEYASITIFRLHGAWCFTQNPKNINHAAYQVKNCKRVFETLNRRRRESRESMRARIEADRKRDAESKDEKSKTDDEDKSLVVVSSGSIRPGKSSASLPPALTISDEVKNPDVEFISLATYAREKMKRDEQKRAQQKADGTPGTVSADKLVDELQEYMDSLQMRTETLADGTPQLLPIADRSMSTALTLTQAQDGSDFVCPPRLINPMQRLALVQMIPRTGPDHVLSEPVIVIRGLFPSPEALGAYARKFLRAQNPEEHCQDLVPVEVDQRIDPWYTRTKVQKMVFLGDDTKNSAVQDFYDGKRAQREELDRVTEQQIKFEKWKEQHQREAGVVSTSTSTSSTSTSTSSTSSTLHEPPKRRDIELIIPPSMKPPERKELKESKERPADTDLPSFLAPRAKSKDATAPSAATAPQTGASFTGKDFFAQFRAGRKT